MLAQSNMGLIIAVVLLASAGLLIAIWIGRALTSYFRDRRWSSVMAGLEGERVKVLDEEDRALCWGVGRPSGKATLQVVVPSMTEVRRGRSAVDERGKRWQIQARAHWPRWRRPVRATGAEPLVAPGLAFYFFHSPVVWGGEGGGVDPGDAGVGESGGFDGLDGGGGFDGGGGADGGGGV